jgi:hypothetical protein
MPGENPGQQHLLSVKVLRELALRFSHAYFHVVAKAGNIKDSRVNAVALGETP